jgi:hypothetical protein
MTVTASGSMVARTGARGLAIGDLLQSTAATA